MIMSMSQRVASRFMRKQTIQLKDIVVGSPNKKDQEILESYLERVNKNGWGKRDVEDILRDWEGFKAVEDALRSLEYRYLLGQYEAYKEIGTSFDVVYKSLKKLISKL